MSFAFYTPLLSNWQARLEPQKSSSKPIWASPGMPKHVGAYADIGPALAHVADALNQIQSSAEQDNKFVYFQPVPGPYSTNSSAALPLPDLPPEACVMNPGPFTEPDRSADPLIQFEYKAKPSIFSSMFSSLVGGGGLAAPPPPAAEEVGVGGAPSTTPSAPPPAMSDEEYARSLQRQFDADTARAQQQQQHPPAAPAGPVPGAGAGDQKPAAAPRYNSLV